MQSVSTTQTMTPICTNNHNFELVMYKDMKFIHNVIQCVSCNSSKFHYLEPLRKGVIEKMAYIVELWLILESQLVEPDPHKMFDELIKNCYKAYYILYPNQHIWSH
jgi:hypothetical protein